MKLSEQHQEAIKSYLRSAIAAVVVTNNNYLLNDAVCYLCEVCHD